MSDELEETDMLEAFLKSLNKASRVQVHTPNALGTMDTSSFPAPGLASRLTALEQERDALRAENERLREVCRDAAPLVLAWASRWSDMNGMPVGELHPAHYDMAGRMGVNLSQFTRAALKGDDT